LTGILYNDENGMWCFNFAFSDGSYSKLDMRGYATKEIKIQPAEKVVKRIIIWYDPSNIRVCGF
jgi:hypothetical protein